MMTTDERLEALENLVALLLAKDFSPEHLSDLLEMRVDQAQRAILVQALRLSVGALKDERGTPE